MEVCDTQSFDDGFMQMSFKVEPCMLAHTHSWNMCPFVHPGEPVKRRHPSTHRGDMCLAVKKGQICEFGDACAFAHSSHELWLHPSRYKTKLCRSGAACARGVCFFAHSQLELRQKGPTKQAVLNPTPPANACAALNMAAAAAAAGAVAITAASSGASQKASVTGTPVSGPVSFDMSAAASSSSSSVARSRSLYSCCFPAAGVPPLTAECSTSSSSSTPMFAACSNVPCSLPASGAGAVSVQEAAPAATAVSVQQLAPAATSDMVYCITPIQPHSEHVYTQQCIAQLQQEVQQHLTQLEQSRMHEQMLAAALQQQFSADAMVMHSSNGGAALQQQQQQQLSGGAAVTSSRTAAMQVPVAALPALTSPVLVLDTLAAPPASGGADFQLQAAAGPGASQLLLPPAAAPQLFIDSSTGAAYWLIDSGELALQQKHQLPQPPLWQQQQQLMVSHSQHCLAQQWTLDTTSGPVHM